MCKNKIKFTTAIVKIPKKILKLIFLLIFIVVEVINQFVISESINGKHRLPIAGYLSNSLCCDLSVNAIHTREIYLAIM